MSWINDPVNSPKHYTDSHPGMECIDLTADTTFCLGNCCKYLWRWITHLEQFSQITNQTKEDA